MHSASVSSSASAASAAASPAATASSAKPKKVSTGGSAPFQSRPDANNPTAMRILAMARTLAIDPATEFYLLPIAVHALTSPPEWSDSGSGGGGAGSAEAASAAAEEFVQSREGGMEWFRDLVVAERERFRKQPGENSPWVQIQDSTTAATAASSTAASSASASPAAAASSSSSPRPSAPYFYNFHSLRSSLSAPPPPLAPALVPSRIERAELDVMRFTSWFTEGGTRKRYVKVSYFMSAEEFEVELVGEGSESSTEPAKIYRVKSLNTKAGPASCWDLHIKATLDVFGRSTTLLQCDSDTRAWIEENARRLLKVRTLLETKLGKYERITEQRRANIPLVELHLRSLMKDVARLKNALAAHRPALAEKYRL